MNELLIEIRKIAKEFYGKQYVIFADEDGFKGCFAYLEDFDYTILKPHKSLKMLLDRMVKYPEEYCIWKINHELSGLSELYEALSDGEGGAVYMGDGMYLNSDGSFTEED